jgi:hypothetical protein
MSLLSGSQGAILIDLKVQMILEAFRWEVIQNFYPPKHISNPFSPLP